MARSRDLNTHAALRTLLAQCLISSGAVAEVLALLDETRALVDDAETRRGVDDVRRWVVLLGRREPVSDAMLPALPIPTSPSDDPRGRHATRLATDTVVALLRGRFDDALMLAHAAADAAARTDRAFWSDGTTTTVLPALATLHALGPGPAAEAVLLASDDGPGGGHAWLTPYLALIAAEASTYAGRFDDAVAEYTSALEAAAAEDVAWVTQGVGTCAALEVALGRFEQARERLDAWRAAGKPEQFGLPSTGHAEALLAEATGDVPTAAAMAARHWDATVGTGRVIWVLLAGGVGPHGARRRRPPAAGAAGGGRRRGGRRAGRDAHRRTVAHRRRRGW